MNLTKIHLDIATKAEVTLHQLSQFIKRHHKIIEASLHLEREESENNIESIGPNGDADALLANNQSLVDVYRCLEDLDAIKRTLGITTQPLK